MKKWIFGLAVAGFGTGLYGCSTEEPSRIITKRFVGKKDNQVIDCTIRAREKSYIDRSGVEEEHRTREEIESYDCDIVGTPYIHFTSNPQVQDANNNQVQDIGTITIQCPGEGNNLLETRVLLGANSIQAGQCSMPLEEGTAIVYHYGACDLPPLGKWQGDLETSVGQAYEHGQAILAEPTPNH